MGGKASNGLKSKYYKNELEAKCKKHLYFFERKFCRVIYHRLLFFATSITFIDVLFLIMDECVIALQLAVFLKEIIRSSAFLNLSLFE